MATFESYFLTWLVIMTYCSLMEGKYNSCTIHVYAIFVAPR